MVTTTNPTELYAEQGYLLLPGLYDAGEVEAMRAAVDAIIARADEAGSSRNHAWRGAERDDRQAELVLKGFHDLPYNDAAFTRAATKPELAATLAELIGPNVQLHHTKMLVKPPENGAPFPMHQDYPFFPHSRHTVTAVSVHLDDANEENGCLRVVPGTHRLGPIADVGEANELSPAEYPPDAGIAIPARAGDALVFNYLTVHGSGVNRSERTRRNVLFQYRDPSDEPVRRGDVEEHVDWGAGLMVAGVNPVWFERRPRFTLQR
jgi:ectoine hydroxylase-related dioxygenase (phytanoyl-CoA dioxygenase family)